MQIYLHIILPQLRLLVERLRLTFTFSQFSLGASILYWMYWVPLWKVELISVFLQKEPKYWKQLEATESHPTSWCFTFLKPKSSLFLGVFVSQKKRWRLLLVVYINHPNRSWWMLMTRENFIPKKAEAGETPRFGSIIATSSSCPLMNSARRCSFLQVPLVPTKSWEQPGVTHIGSLAEKSHVFLNSRWISQ